MKHGPIMTCIRSTCLLVFVGFSLLSMLSLVWRNIDIEERHGDIMGVDSILTSQKDSPQSEVHHQLTAPAFSDGTGIPARQEKRGEAVEDIIVEQHTQMQHVDEAVYDVEEEQRKRKEHLNEACDNLGENRNLPPVSWETTVHFLASDKFNFLFCFVPKVSCTTWKSIMSSLYKSDKNAPPGRFLKMNEIRDAYDVMQRWRTYTRVMFAREPLERALSAYLDKFVFGPEKTSWERTYGRVMVKRYRNRSSTGLTFPLREPIRFEEFIRFITDNGPNAKMTQQTDHWLPIYRMTSPCQIKYDFIGHYETLKDDAPYVLSQYNLSKIVTFPEVHSSRSQEKLIKAYSKIPVDLIHRLVHYYKKDYELFGYSSDDTVKLILNGR